MRFILVVCAVFLFHIQPAQAAPWLEEAINAVGKTASQLGVRRSLWCAAGTNKILRKAGYKGTGSDAARSFAGWGRATTAKPGAIAVMRRGRSGGHVAIVVKDLGSSVLTVSPNSRGKVRYVKFSKKRIYAYRWPASASG